jgi:hypothetical protein
MKNLFLILFLSVAAVSAQAKVFTVKSSSTRTEFPCPFTRGGCSLNEVATKAMDQCYNAGFDRCIMIENNVVTTNFVQNGLCGAQAKWTCVARVQGY